MQVSLFLKKLSFFILILIVFDFLVGKGLKYFYFKIKTGQYAETTYALNTVDKYFLVFGSSRATHNFSSDIIKSEWGPSFYNVGSDGQGIFYDEAILRSILKRYTPKVIILSIDFLEFDPSREAYDRLSKLLPYYSSHQEIRNIINLRSKFEKIKLYSQIYPFNSMILNIIADPIAAKRSDNGYIPLFGVWKEPLKRGEFTEKVIDKVKIKAYQDFISLAVHSGAHVVVVAAPYFLNFDYANSHTFKTASLIAQENGVGFIDYSQDPFFLAHSKFFDDPYHLNDEGAKIFTKMVVGDVKRTIK